jgi:DeoR/GlpR family transcriptional regulator of sugar metabolism
MAESKLKIDIRRNKILELLRQDGHVQVLQLSELLGATPVTIRTDLAAMEQEGYLERVQGGAVQRLRPARLQQNVSIDREAEKQAIAALVSRKIRDGDTIFINSGTTTLCVAAALKEHQNLNVVTNSLQVAVELGSVPSFRVLLLGGEINARYTFTSGSDALEQLSHYQADWAILAVDGVDLTGVTTYHPEEAGINRTMIDRAKRTVIAADHTKIGRAGFTHICDIGSGLTLATDAGSDASILERLAEAGLAILR